VVQGDTLASFNASSYQWLFDGNIIPGANTNIYVAPQTGDYSVQVTDTNGCREISNSTHISIAGITQFFESGQVNIYPNPTSSQIYISLRGINGPVELRILSIAGQEIRTQTVNTASNSTMLFDIAELPAGIYELMVLDQGRYNCYKLLKQ